MKYFTDGNNIYAYELDGSQDVYIKEHFTAITEAQADAMREDKQQQYFNALSYAQKRAMEYPSIKDQLDVIFHSGLDAWKQQIQAVKDKYPKQ